MCSVEGHGQPGMVLAGEATRIQGWEVVGTILESKRNTELDFSHDATVPERVQVQMRQ